MEIGVLWDVYFDRRFVVISLEFGVLWDVSCDGSWDVLFFTDGSIVE